MRSLGPYLVEILVRTLNFAANETGDGPLFDEPRAIRPMRTREITQIIPAINMTIFDFLSNPAFGAGAEI